MSTESHSTVQKAGVAVAVLAGLAAVIVTGLLLREYGPGNMGIGLLAGAAIGLAGAGIGTWRVSRRPDGATTFERAWTKTGDERDDAVLTRALAVLGLLSFPLTAVAAIAVGFGTPVEMALALLLFAEIGVGAAAFAVVNRRS
jgi:drug/metabolite transporter (DMT)-like permease